MVNADADMCSRCQHHYDDHERIEEYKPEIRKWAVIAQVCHGGGRCDCRGFYSYEDAAMDAAIDRADARRERMGY